MVSILYVRGVSEKFKEQVKDIILGPLQGTPVHHRHLQHHVRRFAISTEVDSYAGKATQARQDPTEEPDKVSPTAIGQEGLFRSATPTLLGLGGITHISKKITLIQKLKEDNQTEHKFRQLRQKKKV
jgi:hypothetical protein